VPSKGCKKDGEILREAYPEWLLGFFAALRMTARWMITRKD